MDSSIHKTDLTTRVYGTVLNPHVTLNLLNGSSAKFSLLPVFI